MGTQLMMEFVEVRRCAVCGEVLVRREGEKAYAFRERRTCSTACRTKLAGKSRHIVSAPKECIYCHSVMHRREDESNASFQRRLTCGRECGHALAAMNHRKPLVSQRCVICGSMFERRHQQARRVCSAGCRDRLLGKQAEEKRKPQVQITCGQCGVVFSASPYENRKYCSIACTNQAFRTRERQANCLRCGKTMSGSRLRYCSQECSWKRNEHVRRKCGTCGDLFHPNTKTQRFCSLECIPKKRGPRVPLKTLKCEECGSPFDVKLRVHQRFCSTRCYHKNQENLIGCERCGKLFRAGKEGGQKFCSRTCMRTGWNSPRICEWCNTTFTPVHRIQATCSPRCARNHRYAREREQGLHQPVALTCQTCGKGFVVSAGNYRSSMKRNRPPRFCSKDCHYASTKGNFPAHFVDYMMGRKSTSIEVATYEALEALGVMFERQRFIGRYLVDAYIPTTRTVIECQGDFFHCNPEVYPDGPKFATQRKNVAKDIERFAYLRTRGYTIVELWEKDIREQGALTLLKEALGA